MIDLKEILKEHSNCLSSRATFKSVLSDKYPDEKRMINLLTTVYESGIANRIKSKSVLSELELRTIIIQMEEEYGIVVQYSQDAIIAWANAFDVKIVKTVDISDLVNKSSKKTSIEVASNQIKDLSEKIETEPICKNDTSHETEKLVHGNSNDYQIEQLNGYVKIKKFVGFDAETIIVPNQIGGLPVRIIGEEAFTKIKVKKIIITKGIEIIENGAFCGCRSLVEVKLPRTLKKIGHNSDKSYKGVFEESSLNRIELPEELTYIGHKAFSFCKLEEINIPDNVTEIGSYAFCGCEKLKRMSLPDNLNKIGNYAFKNCVNLDEIKLPQNLEVIGEGWFSGCKLLNKVDFPDSLLSIEEKAFYDTAIYRLDLPASVTKIGELAFEKCGKLREVILPQGLISIENRAFADCISLTKVLIPRSVTKIGNNVFHISYDSGPYRIDYKINNRLTILCYAGSYGLEYARENGFQVSNAADYTG